MTEVNITKATKSALSDIVSSVADNANVLADIQSDNKMTLELVNTIFQRVEDMSKKFDEVLNSGIKKPRITPKKIPTEETTPKKKRVVVKKEQTAEPKTDGKLIKNIMTYFKIKYIEDQKFFDSILEENQAKSIFAEHEEDWSNKTGDSKIKTQASLLYKNLNKAQKKKIREKMMDENDAASTNNDDDIVVGDSDN